MARKEGIFAATYYFGNSKMKNIIMICLSAILFVGCIEQTVITSGDAVSKVIDYKNGVLYFPYTRSDFAKVLSAYREKHPEIKIISICGNGNDTNGRDAGYFVIVEQQ